MIVQRELAHRFCGVLYGHETRWSLRLKPFWHVEIVDRLQRTDFVPPPSLDAAVLWLSHRARPLLGDPAWRTYLAILDAVFGRGASLKQALRPWVSRIQIRRLGRDLRFDKLARPTSLLFEQSLGIVRFIDRTPGGR